MTTVGEVIEFDAMPTRALGVLRWISRCSMHDDGPSERLVQRVLELDRDEPKSKFWGLHGWSKALGYYEGASPGSHVRKALVLAGIRRFDRGPLIYRWDYEANKYRLEHAEIR
jgi:hypothetical protein